MAAWDHVASFGREQALTNGDFQLGRAGMSARRKLFQRGQRMAEHRPILFHAPTRKSVGYFGAVRLRDGKFLLRWEAGSIQRGDLLSVPLGVPPSQQQSATPGGGHQR
jgi:hypothetical protein